MSSEDNPPKKPSIHEESRQEVVQNGLVEENGMSDDSGDKGSDNEASTTNTHDSTTQTKPKTKRQGSSDQQNSSDNEESEPGIDFATQTEWATRRIGKRNRNLSEYLRFLWYDNKERALRLAGPSDAISIVTLVKDVMGKAIDRLRTRSRSKIVAPFDPGDSKQLMQVADVLFRAKVMLEDPFPQGTFHLQTGLRHGLKDGQGLLVMNAQGLTMEERMEVTKKHRAFVDDIYFSPTRATLWMYKGFQQVFEPMQGRLVYGYFIHLHPLMRDGKLFVNILATHKDSNETTTAIILVTPAILVNGWLSSASLVHPFPKKIKPYSQHGQQMVEEIQRLIDAGERLICLEANPPGAQPTPTRIAHSAMPSDRGTNNPNRHQRSNSQGSTRNGNREAHIWSVNLGQVEQIIYEKLLSFECMKEAKVSLAVFTLLQERCPQWKVLTHELTRAIMLSTAKDVHILKDPADWFVAFLSNAHTAIANGKCPQFFLRRVNMLAGMDRESFKHMEGDVGWMVKNIKEQPFVLAQLICQ